jgi:hypothetical protein
MRPKTRLTVGRPSRLRPLVTLGLAAALLVGGFGSAGGNSRPDRRRVDLEPPSFSDPTSITHPLFPKSTLSQVIQLGVEGGDKLRFEATQLPGTRTIKWNGQRVQTVVTHFVAYTNGRLVEVAHDFYAKADDGAVWYFGEDVDNYEHGVLANHDGTWLAGRDGPPGMIMPADPKVGDERYDVALAVPIDAKPGPVPRELKKLSTGSARIFRAAPARRWHRISASLDRMDAAWDAHRAGNVPKLLDIQMSDALHALHPAVDARKPAAVRQAAINAAQASLDLQLQYRPRMDIDRARLGQWRRQLRVDRAAHDAAAAAGDQVTLKTIRDRIDDCPAL